MPTTPWLTPEIIVAFIDLAKGLIWPALIGIIVYTFIDDIRRMIPDIVEFGATGVKLRTEKAQQQAQTTTEIKAEKLAQTELKDFLGESRSEAMRRIEIDLRRSVDAAVESQKIKPDERLDYVIKHLAITRLERHFFKVYGAIFGSQVTALEALRRVGSADISVVRRGFDTAKKSDPEFYGEYPFEEWMFYLTSNDLVKVDGETVSLEPIGDDFLVFLFAYKLPLKRG